MITVAIIAITLALFLGILWPTPGPSWVCMLIAAIALTFKFLP